MLRAPEVAMTEREFRCNKRAQFQAVLVELEDLAENANLLPDNVNRKIQSAIRSIEWAREDCLDWWAGY